MDLTSTSTELAVCFGRRLPAHVRVQLLILTEWLHGRSARGGYGVIPSERSWSSSEFLQNFPMQLLCNYESLEGSSAKTLEARQRQQQKIKVGFC